jgi:PIN domain nuclease of toxin-antitoxin system
MAIYLDTHVVVWLYAGETSKLSQAAEELINTNDLLISPIVLLEMNYLYEIGRISQPAETAFSDLSERIGLKVCEKSFSEAVSQALSLSWTRDPFDRLIVGHASINGDRLLTKDEVIPGKLRGSKLVKPHQTEGKQCQPNGGNRIKKYCFLSYSADLSPAGPSTILLHPKPGNRELQLCHPFKPGLFVPALYFLPGVFELVDRRIPVERIQHAPFVIGMHTARPTAVGDFAEQGDAHEPMQTGPDF